MTLVQTIATLVGLVAFATALGLVWRALNGRVHRTSGTALITASELPGSPALGARATLLQFSTELCAPCRATNTILGTLAGENDDIAHIDIDLTHRAEVANRFNIMQTPTTLILDERGAVRARIGGAARPAEVRAELERILVSA